jgi:hypothetical protein
MVRDLLRRNKTITSLSLSHYVFFVAMMPLFELWMVCVAIPQPYKA